MSDSEDDYMSDAFLSKLEDTRPGLIQGKKAEKLMKEEKIKVTFSPFFLMGFF